MARHKRVASLSALLERVQQGSDLADRLGGVETTCAEHTRFREWLNADSYHEVDVVSEIRERVGMDTLRPIRLEEVEKATGQHRNPLGFVADLELRDHCPALDLLSQDWLHGFLSDGVMSTEMWRFTQSAARPMGDWGAFMKANWRYPAHFATKAAPMCRIFDEEHRFPDGPQRIRGDASELPGPYALMRQVIKLQFKTRTS